MGVFIYNRQGMREAHESRFIPTKAMQVYTAQQHLYDSLLIRRGPHTDTHTHADRNGPKWSLMGPPARRTVGLRVRVAGWLPCHECAAGYPLIVRPVSPSQPGGRRRREALGPGRGRPRSQGDEPGREEKPEKQTERTTTNLLRTALSCTLF